jgi:hypothetical protein|tara:strand:+ start:1003 stop:1476 length:474 start_codon:yes stop_codon:yes gene_type:complete
MKSTFDVLTNSLKQKHKLALNWFQKNSGKEFKGWVPNLDQNVLLASKAKGIYKPKNLDFALSIRLSKDGPYNDQIQQEENGKISLKYFQENKNLNERDLEYTNVGLKRCMKETIPVGIIVQTSKKPNSKYKIMGTGLIKKWEDGYYFIDVFSDSGEI